MSEPHEHGVAAGSGAPQPNPEFGPGAHHDTHPDVPYGVEDQTHDEANHDAQPDAHPDASHGSSADSAGPPVVGAPGRVRVGAAKTARALGRGTVKGARLAGRGGRAGTTRARNFARAEGADESGLARLIELHFVNLCGDAALTVSLAGTIFAIPTDQARAQVAQFLILTMAPFALLAPFVGPMLDRFRHGRRWAIGTTFAVRAFLCWVLAGAVVTNSAWLFPAALGCLVASRAYGVTRAAAIPRLLPPGFSLVSANSRIALAGVVGMAVGGALAGAVARIGPDWSLRVAFIIYIVGTVLAIRLPARVDSTVGEDDSPPEGLSATLPADPVTPVERGLGSIPRRIRDRVSSLPRSVRTALVAAVGTRALLGFLTLFMLFLMRENPIPGYSGALVLGLVIGAAGAGNALGAGLGNLLRNTKPDAIIAISLAAAVAAAVATAAAYSLITLLVLGLATGLCAQIIKLSLDAIIQRDVVDTVRTQVFAWSETVLQMAWVVGGGLGIALPLEPVVGFGVIAAVLVVVGLFSIKVHRS